MDELLKAIDKYPNKTQLVIKWDDGRVITGEIDTIYETNNGLDEKDCGYKEYHSCVLRVLMVNSVAAKNTKVGKLIDVSMEDTPSEIYLTDGEAIWQMKKESSNDEKGDNEYL